MTALLQTGPKTPTLNRSVPTCLVKPLHRRLISISTTASYLTTIALCEVVELNDFNFEISTANLDQLHSYTPDPELMAMLDFTSDTSKHPTSQPTPMINDRITRSKWKAINTRDQEQLPVDNKADTDDNAKRANEKNGKAITEANPAKEGDDSEGDASNDDAKKDVDEATEINGDDGGNNDDKGTKDGNNGDKTDEGETESKDEDEGETESKDEDEAESKNEGEGETESKDEGEGETESKNEGEDMEMSSNKDETGDSIDTSRNDDTADGQLREVDSGSCSNPILILDETEEPQPKRRKRSTHNSHQPRRKRSTHNSHQPRRRPSITAVTVCLQHIVDQSGSTWKWQRRGEKGWKNTSTGAIWSGDAMASEKYRLSLHACYNGSSHPFTLQHFQGFWIGVVYETLVQVSDDSMNLLLGGESVSGGMSTV